MPIMRCTYNMQEVAERIRSLNQTASYEEIAYLMGRSKETIYAWAHARGKITKGDYELLFRLYAEKSKE